jgi:stearoyl-CoA desaturase (Delta-9 desaturase)
MPETVISEAQAGPDPVRSALTFASRAQRISALVLIFVPLAGAAGAAVWAWQDGVSWTILALAAGMYLVTGHGLSVGFHRMLAHRSFRPNRAVKIALAVAGSMAIEGSVFTWVAQHRRHHRFADAADDPHSPWRYGSGFGPQLRGLWHAHVGWFFVANPSDPQRWIPDLLADGDLQLISRTAALWAWLSIVLPFFLGWLLTGTLAGALSALLWASGVRILLLHHVTWAVNSVGHMFGRRPFRTRDHSTNFAPLALLSCGDSWHNAHHAYPSLARHGIDRGQIDSSAMLIRGFERLRWASDANWPTQANTARRRKLAAHTAPDKAETGDGTVDRAPWVAVGQQGRPASQGAWHGEEVH